MKNEEVKYAFVNAALTGFVLCCKKYCYYKEAFMDTLALRSLSYGLFIIGTKDGGRAAGCTVNTVTQVTSDPVLISVCVNRNNYTNKCIKESKRFSASILSEDATGETIGIFGFQSGKDTDKWGQVPHELTAGGFPVLKNGISGWLECTLESSLDLPTHTIFAGRLVDAQAAGGTPMTYAYYHKVIKGKTPPAAPSYEKPSGDVWVCPVCGYVYDLSAGPFEQLAGGWKCPLCGSKKESFKKQGA
jgi:flavin reductase (DIM6/NTAB) family NADH-FMN oxidoreductase RutF/rubredoxin